MASSSVAAPSAVRKLDLSLLQRDLAEACRRPDVDERRRELLRLLIALTNAGAGAYFLKDPTGELKAVVRSAVGPVRTPVESVPDDLQLAAASACTGERLVKTSRNDGRGTIVLASPIQGESSPIGALALLLFLGAAPAETFATVLQFAVALAAELERRDASRLEGLGLQAVLELLAEVRGCSDLDAAGLAVVDALFEASGAEQVALALTPPGKEKPAPLTALSGVTEFDRRAEVVRTLETLLNEARGTTGCRVWRVGDGEPEPVHRLVAESMNAREIWTLPVTSTGSGAIGALALLFSSAAEGSEARCRGIESMAAALGDTLDAMRRGRVADPGKRKSLGRKGKAIVGLSLAGSLLGLMLLPVDHRLTASSVLEPEVRRFVVAPFDGVLEASRVKPGDRVEGGDVLATLEGRELELEFVGLQAERNKLTKQRDVALASGETAATQIAELELARIRARLDLLEYKRAHLEVESPIGGIVTQGELSREEGSPVTTGQRLFELAPLDRMVAEVEVPAEDVAYFVDGARAKLELDAFPGKEFHGPVQRLHPRATIRDGRSVYLAEIELENSDLRLRPGMRGEVRILVGRRPLGWVLFHRAWEKGVQWLL